MRVSPAALLCTLLALPLTGCFVLDELDKGNAIMDAHSPTRGKGGTAAPPEASVAKRDAPPTAEERSRNWWAGATTVTSRAEDSGDPTVRCRTGGATLFMRRSDCLSGGGRPVDR